MLALEELDDDMRGIFYRKYCTDYGTKKMKAVIFLKRW
jgi:hypothetical protein